MNEKQKLLLRKRSECGFKNTDDQPVDLTGTTPRQTSDPEPAGSQEGAQGGKGEKLVANPDLTSPKLDRLF